ncbi:MAG: DUF4330 family protein [Patescibacteria group bacterium]
MGLTIFVVKFYGRKPTERIIRIQVVGKSWTQNYNNYAGYRPPFWLSENIQVGDVETTVNGWRSGEIIAIEKYDRWGTDVDLYLTAKLQGEINGRTNKFIYNSKPVEVGAFIELHLTRADVLGQIIDDNVPEKGYPEKEIVATVRVRNEDPWVVEALRVGDTMLNGPQKKQVAVVETISIEPPTSAIFLSDATIDNPPNNTFLSIDPRAKDVVMKVRLRAQHHDSGWYFGGHQSIKIGQQIWIYFSQVNVMATIQSIQDAPSL